jgi:hypothetical protein
VREFALGHDGRMATTNRSPADVLRAMVEMFATGDVSDVADVVAADYLDHQGLGTGEMHGVDGFVEVVAVARHGYAQLSVEMISFDERPDRVEGRLRWQGVRDDNTVVRRETIETVRVASGLAVEHWGTHV